MKVLQVIPHYVPAYGFGGPLQVAHNLARALIRRGHAVTVCTTDRMGEGSVLDVARDEAVNLDGVRVFYEPVPYLERWGFSPRLLERASREAEEADVVFVHDHFQFAGIAGALAARRRKRPFVLFPHNSLRDRAIASSRRVLKRSYLHGVYFRLMRTAMFIAFTSEEEMAGSYLRERGLVVPNAVEVREACDREEHGSFRKDNPHLEGKLLFGFLGRLDVRQKGLDLLLEAFARVARRTPECHLVLAGPSEAGGREVIEGLIAKLKLEDRVTLTGLLTGRAKETFLQDVDVFCSMSRFEGLSIALLEAMAIGRPVLVTNTVGLSGEIVRRGAGFVTTFDVEGIEAALGRGLDAVWREAAGPRARALVLEAHTWDRSAGMLLRALAGRGVGTEPSAETGDA